MKFPIRSLAAALVAASLLAAPLAQACTRLVYQGLDEQILTARSMDWKEDIETNLWIFPRGMERSGEAGPNSLRWTSKYGSVIASGYDISTTDGLNEAGLSAGVLWLGAGARPSSRAWPRRRPLLASRALISLRLVSPKFL